MPMMMVVAPAMMARAPSVMTMTTPAVPPVPAPAMTVMSTPAMVSAMMMVVPAPAVLNRDDARLRRLGQRYGRSKRCRLNHTRRNADGTEGKCRRGEQTPRPMCECAKRHISLRRILRRGDPGAMTGR